MDDNAKLDSGASRFAVETLKSRRPDWLRASALAGVGAVGALGLAVSLASAAAAPEAAPAAAATAAGPHGDKQAMLTQYCGGCHNDRTKTAGFALSSIDANDVSANIANWEKVLRRVSLGEMPPRGMRRPDAQQISSFTNWLEQSLDQVAAKHPDPGRATLRRLNRAEYANAVRDLLDIKIDLSRELPADDSGYGFDNIADVLTVSPTLLDRYVSVGGKVTRLALGQSSVNPFVVEYEPPKDRQFFGGGTPAYNERVSDDLPLDSRGGGTLKYYAPHDGTYTLQVALTGNGYGAAGSTGDPLEVTLPLKAGDHVIGAAFKRRLGLDERTVKIYSGGNGSNFYGATVPPWKDREPVELNFYVDGAPVKSFTVPSYPEGPTTQQNFPRDIVKIVVKGPYDVKGPGDTPSRRKVFICQPSAKLSEAACAQKIIANLARQAYRRPVTAADINPLMKVYEEGRAGGGFEQGVSLAVQSMLVSPHFIFVQEKKPTGAPGSMSPISDIELASRLSLFLWSSIPDERLLQAAEKKQLRNPTVLRREISRMLADPKAQALADNFAGQWLYLRNISEQRPDDDVYPEFDERLRKAMLAETQSFVMSIFRENSSVVDFLNANYTFLNERLAKHYGIPGVYGPEMRKVKVPEGTSRGGLLGQASILMVTSYNNKTSVVKRGHWILDNILAAPPPPPPADVPAIVEVKSGRKLSSREAIDKTAPVR